MVERYDLSKHKLESGKVESFAWPGGYPLYYLCVDGGVLCPDCVTDNLALIEGTDPDCPDDKQWTVVGAQVNYEDHDLRCDHCNKEINSAYGLD